MALLQFSDTTNKNGIVQVIRRRTGTNTASGGSYPIEDITVDVNLALANFFMIANAAAGKNQPIDDTNHTDYPVVYADIQDGVQDIVVTLDANGNQIQNIYKVIFTKPDGTKQILDQVDISDSNNYFITNPTTGIPTSYDISANGIFLHQIPNFTLAGALEIWTSRGGSYFTAADTTKRPGIPERFGEYLVLRPSYFYCLEKGKEQAGAYGIALYGRDGKSGMEEDIRKFYANSNYDVQDVMTSECVNPI